MANKHQLASEETRAKLLQSAVAVMQAQGAGGFTMDAVARSAGVSKGGLLHHFPSKDALIEAILRQLFAEFETRVQRYLAAEPEAPGRLLRAYVRASFDDDPLPLEITAMLLISITENERLIHMIQADTATWHQRLTHDGIPAARAAVIRLATDAQWTERLIQEGDHDDQRELVEELLRLTHLED